MCVSLKIKIEGIFIRELECVGQKYLCIMTLSMNQLERRLGSAM